MAAGNVEVLQHKVFFDILYLTGRRGKEGLRKLSKDSFQLKISPESNEYTEMTFNEVTKKNQGHETSTSANLHHNDHTIISAQPDSVKCPVNSFKHYIETLNPNLDAFFQRPNKRKDGFDSMVLGKETLGNMMKTISEVASISKEYTNHSIKHTTYPQGNIKCYKAQKHAITPIVPSVTPQNAVIPFEANLAEEPPMKHITTPSQLVQNNTNQLRQAPVLFQ